MVTKSRNIHAHEGCIESNSQNNIKKTDNTHIHIIQVRRSSVAPCELISYLTRIFSNLNMPQIGNLPVDCHYADLIVV